MAIRRIFVLLNHITKDTFSLSNNLRDHLLGLVVLNMVIESMINKKDVDLLAFLLAQLMYTAQPTCFEGSGCGMRYHAMSLLDCVVRKK